MTEKKPKAKTKAPGTVRAKFPVAEYVEAPELVGIPTGNENEVRIVSTEPSEWEIGEVSVKVEQMMEDADALQSAPVFLLPVDGPDYRITPTGDIVLFDGSPIPEDHHVHPSHRRIAAERKEASK